ncbi:MAG TPA: hypothetical protein VF762_06870 [Blastocatellia bacterium]
MKRILPPGIFVALFALACGQATGFNGGVDALLAIPLIAFDTKPYANGERVNRVDREGRVERPARGAEFVISKFDRDIIKEFGKAWRNSGNGRTDYESVVLIFRMIDGSYRARNLGQTNERRSFTFRWHPGAVAVIHTHPNNADPRPQEPDCLIADKYGVPMFTITASGMFVYDPYTKKITRVQAGLNWLDPSRWSPNDAGDNE